MNEDSSMWRSLKKLTKAEPVDPEQVGVDSRLAIKCGQYQHLFWLYRSIILTGPHHSSTNFTMDSAVAFLALA